MTRRTDRVADLLRRELALIVQREMADPRVGIVSFSSVDVSPDLSYARILVSVVGDGDRREQSVACLQRAQGFLRTRLAQHLELRSVPRLDFVLDRGAEYSMRIEAILENLDDAHDEDP